METLHTEDIATTKFKWTYPIYPSKIKVILFTRSRKYQNNEPVLTLNGQNVKYTKTIRFLVVIFDQKATWKEQINYLKRDCTLRINLIKTIGHHIWGTERNIQVSLT